MVVRVVGVGQRGAGDDGAGPAVIDVLRENEFGGNDIELYEIPEPSALLPLLEGAQRVIVIDAAVGDFEPGEVLVLGPEEVSAHALSPVSTHGMSVGQTIALARVLSPGVVCADIHLVAIGGEQPKGVAYGLSEPVAAAIPRAAKLAKLLVLQALSRVQAGAAPAV